jgi:hypothetical protein
MKIQDKQMKGLKYTKVTYKKIEGECQFHAAKYAICYN